MHQQADKAGRSGSRVAARAVLVAAVLAACGLGAPATGHAQWPFPGPAAPPVITVIGDSIIASGLPSGRTTLTATRLDAVTAKPVVIGKYVATASRFSPFTVNTSGPSFFKPTGDCWQKGALTSGLTPDLLQGDKLTFTGTAFFGSPPSTTVTVGAPAQGSRPGPVPVCAILAPWARNAITSATKGTGASVSVSGVAQKFATEVSLTATDGTSTTAPLTLAPQADGHWSATLDASALTHTPITITPVFKVPDVSTGASAQIAGAKATVTAGT
jgi:hypothetical protein